MLLDTVPYEVLESLKRSGVTEDQISVMTESEVLRQYLASEGLSDYYNTLSQLIRVSTKNKNFNSVSPLFVKR